MERAGQIKKASWIAIGGNAFLTVLKITTGLVWGSLAVTGDGIDNAADLAGSIITLLAAIIIARPPDREHPYGHYRAETLATALLAFLIFFGGIQLMVSSVERLLGDTEPQMPSIAVIYVIIVSVAGKILLALSQFYYGRRTGSGMLVANGKNMRNDVLLSSGVLAGLVFTFLLDLPDIDSVLALLISALIIATAVRIYLKIHAELMDGVRDSGIYESITAAVRETPGAFNPHRMRVRKIGDYIVIEFDIEVDGALTVRESHEIAVKVEKAIRAIVKNVYDIMIHVEPRGNVEHHEGFGLSRDDVAGDGSE